MSPSLRIGLVVAALGGALTSLVFFAQGSEDPVPDLPAGMDLPDLALRFTLHHPAVTTVIPGMRTVRHVEKNLSVADGTPFPADLLAAMRRHRWDRNAVIP